jgi:PAS domain S-box-containing protein
VNATNSDDIQRLARSIEDLTAALARPGSRRRRVVEHILRALRDSLLREADLLALASLRDILRHEARRPAILDLDNHLARRMDELTEANRELVELKEHLAAELSAMARLHEFGTRLLLVNEVQTVLDQTLLATMELQNADFGIVQLNDSERGGLVIVAQRNFLPTFLDHFALVREGECVCGRAARERVRVIVEDVQTDESFAAHRPVAMEAGFRAVQSTPLIGHDAALLGVLSTYFRNPHRSSNTELRLTDLYSRYAMQLVERKRAEEERSKLAAIVQNSADFIGIAALDGKVLFLNAAARRMVGLGETGPVDENILSFVAAEDAAHVTAEIMPRLERDGFWDGESSLRHFRTGAVVPVLQHVFHIREPRTERPLAIATVCRDITERRRAELAASKAHQELAHVARVLSIGELTASIAHEINQPLAAIVANGNACRRWIDREIPDLEEAKARIASIVRDANRASEVIQRIRAYSTKASLPRSRLNVNDVIREVLALTLGEVTREGVVLQLNLSCMLPEVVADRVELQQVILNLVINSIEAMRSVAGRPRLLLIASCLQDSTTVEVLVRDSGCGVDAQLLPRLFEPLFTTKPNGMGLGLSISRRIIEAHGGQLIASVNPLHGLTLSFGLPASREPTRE